MSFARFAAFEQSERDVESTFMEMSEDSAAAFWLLMRGGHEISSGRDLKSGGRFV